MQLTPPPDTVKYVNRVIDNNFDTVELSKRGSQIAFETLVMLVMQASKGCTNPQIVRTLLKLQLGLTQ